MPTRAQLKKQQPQSRCLFGEMGRERTRLLDGVWRVVPRNFRVVLGSKLVFAELESALPVSGFYLAGAQHAYLRVAAIGVATGHGSACHLGSVVVAVPQRVQTEVQQHCSITAIENGDDRWRQSASLAHANIAMSEVEPRFFEQLVDSHSPSFGCSRRTLFITVARHPVK